MAIRLVGHASASGGEKCVHVEQGGFVVPSGAPPSRKGRAGQADNDRQWQQERCKWPFSWRGPTAGNRQAVALSLDE